MVYERIQILIDYLKYNEITSHTNIDVNDLISICKMHSLLPMLYLSLKKYGVNLTEKQTTFLKKEYQVAVYKEATQELEKKVILDELEKNKIKCAALKGSVLKNLYSSPEIRTMCDLDILFEDKRTKDIHKIMKNLGYSCLDKGGNHDVFLKKPFMNVEMHRHLIDSCYPCLRKYYDNIWNFLYPFSGFSYVCEMSKEDFYVYMITHIAKHFANGGVGIRYIFDTYIFLKKYKNELQFDYIYNELEKMKLIKFEKSFVNLVEIWFNGKQTTENEEILSQYIVESRTHGTLEHAQAVKIILGDGENNLIKQGKIIYLLKKIFPPYSFMKKRNPVLNKCPILLPVFYFFRIIEGIFSKKNRIKAELTGLERFNEVKAKQIQELHKEIGVEDKVAR